MTASPINADGSITIAGRIDLAYNATRPPAGLRSVARAVWLVVATDRGPEHESDVAVTAWPGLHEVIVLVSVRALWIRRKRRRQLVAAATQAAAVQLAPGTVPRVHVRERWRGPP